MVTQRSQNHLVSHFRELFPGRLPKQLSARQSTGSRRDLKEPIELCAMTWGEYKLHISSCCMEIVSLLCREKYGLC